MLELLKVIVRAVVLERDEDGVIIGEQLTEPVALYNLDQYEEYVAGLRAEISGAMPKGEVDARTGVGQSGAG